VTPVTFSWRKQPDGCPPRHDQRQLTATEASGLPDKAIRAWGLLQQAVGELRTGRPASSGHRFTVGPTVARMVHYVSYGTPRGEYGHACRAAVVADVDPGRVVLCVLNPSGVFFHAARHDEGDDPGDGLASPLCTGRRHEGGTWHWPA
jgi:hypothetical protein